jgi:putative endopeptidase
MPRRADPVHVLARIEISPENPSMKSTLLCAAALSALLVAPAFAQDKAADLSAPKFGTWGVDLSARDMSVKPGDDFYRYAEGSALDKLVIPADRSSYGSFNALRELSDARTHAVLEAAAANKAATGDEAKIGTFYRAAMDEAKAEQLDAAPLQPELQAIKAADTREALAAIMGGSNESFNGTFFFPYTTRDAKEPERYSVHLYQGGLGLPDRDYYLKADFADKKAAYQAYVAQQLGLIGWADPEANAKAIVDLETRIAEVSWTAEQQRDDVASYNPMSPAELQKAAPGFPWAAFLKAARLGSRDRVIVDQNTAIFKIAQIFADTPAPVLQAWLAFNLADNASPYLSKRFVDANFGFRLKTLRGQQQQQVRWKRAVTATNGQLGEAIGRVYVADYFPASSKAKMVQLVGDLRLALQHRIEKLEWMSPATKKEALDKLANFHVKIGYPDKWRDYSAYEVREGDLYGNVERGAAFEWRRQVARLDQPVDRTEWGMTPQTVNAYYNSTGNEIVFPAAILQPPFFDPDADMAVNYGAIGAVIGHEITHGFDDQGRVSDGRGVLRDWWTAEDAAKFKAQAKIYGAEFEAIDFPDAPGMHIRPDLTMGENIADLGGMLMALDAYHASLKGKPAPVIDGLTGDQRFFLANAQVWRSKDKPDALKVQLASNPHSPGSARAGTAIRNIDAWYAAFDVKPGDKLYIPPEQRARIW